MNSLTSNPNLWLNWLRHLALLTFLWFVSLTFLSLIWRSRREYPVSRRIRLFILIMSIMLMAEVIVQAYWQGFGHLHPQLSANQKRYDKRLNSQVRILKKGNIADRQGRLLAYDKIESNDRRRCYPLKQSGAHLIGYEHRFYGQSGLEGAFHTFLMGWSFDSPREKWNYVRNSLWRYRLLGNNLHVTLDLDLQRIAWELLDGRTGALAAVIPSTGEVIACVSCPSFDPNKMNADFFSRLSKAEEAPFLNRTMQGAYPPGSLFKVITAIAAIKQKSSWYIHCPREGYLPPKERLWIRDHEYYESAGRSGEWQGHGTIGLPEALIKSSNVFFAKLGVELGGEKLTAEAELFGFNRELRFSPLLERSKYLSIRTSFFPYRQKYYEAEEARLAIGQEEILCSPLHMALIVAAVANGGCLMEPRLLSDAKPLMRNRVCSVQIARKMRSLMREVVLKGTGYQARDDQLAIAGKTGTAENPHGKGHAWFMGFAPYDKPEVAVAVIIENGGYGGQVAAPIARDFLLAAL